MENLLGPGSRVKHPAFGDGVVMQLHPENYEICFMQFGLKNVPRDYDRFQVIERIAPAEEVSLNEAEKSLTKILRHWLGFDPSIVPMGDRWQDGKIIFQPKDGQSKEIEPEAFFHKIVMMRDRLRVLEQQINADKKLTDENKVNLQQYITRCYGSMTTFNFLFKNREDYFVGESTKE